VQSRICSMFAFDIFVWLATELISSALFIVAPVVRPKQILATLAV
jgi:heme exporter protein D